MLRRALELGTTTIAATPHLREDHPAVRPGELADKCKSLADALGEPGLTLVSGAEVDTLWALEGSPEDLRLASYGQRGRDLLLETPYGHLTFVYSVSCCCACGGKGTE